MRKIILVIKPIKNKSYEYDAYISYSNADYPFIEKVVSQIQPLPLDQSQDIVTGNAYMSSLKSYQMQLHQTGYIYQYTSLEMIFFKEHFTYIKYLTKSLVPNQCTSL